MKKHLLIVDLMLYLLQQMLLCWVASQLVPQAEKPSTSTAVPVALEPYMFTSQASTLQRLLDIHYPLLISKLFSKSLPRSDDSPSLKGYYWIQ